ncbi:sialate O-acetylesterase [Alienimonas sp. DA493]|uniref:sialate O-acetylesterase n=1 Tax=Alienimonas sp. DA493 TaxID=3373605 RepID=UPI0037548689
MTIRLFVALLASGMTGATAAPGGEPLKVFILAGQSNMQGHAAVETLDGMALHPDAAPLLEKLRGPDGEPVVLEDVRISSVGANRDETIVRTDPLTVGFGAEGRGPKIGPEFSFGVVMHELLGEPILLVKTAWGGKSLHTDFRPPSAGSRPLTEGELKRAEQRGEDPAALQAELNDRSGAYYRKIMAHVKAALADVDELHPAYDPADGYELAGFVWFQGWNDMVAGDQYPNRGEPGGYDEYSRLLAAFIRDVRKDLGAPELPFVIGVLGVGGPVADYRPDQQRYADVHQNFRDAMAAPAALPEFEDNVAVVRTEEYWDGEVADLVHRRNRLNGERNRIAKAERAGDLTAEQADAAREALPDALTAEEEARLEASVSNAEYHYLGSATILARIGEAFAQANAALLESAGEGR